MSYMRRPVYAWAGSLCPDECELEDCRDPTHTSINLWVYKTPDDRVGAVNLEDYGIEGGIWIRGDLFDELVLCRFAQMVNDGVVSETADRILRGDSPTAGNFGASELLEFLGVNDLMAYWAELAAKRRAGSPEEP